MLDTYLDLLGTDIPSKYLVCLQHVQTCLQDVFNTCLQDVLKNCLEDVFSITIFRLPRRLQDVSRDVFKTSLQDVFKTSRKTKNYYAENVLKTSSRRLEDQQMFAGNYLHCMFY